MTTKQRNARGYVLIQDAPADHDRFGTHKAIAEAVVDTMDANPTLRTVGIVGPWGSGKSTVLRLFEAEIASRYRASAPPIFTFDAWLHHGEPVRRAFLEDFFRFCTRAAPATEVAMQASVDHVTGRSTTTETHDETRITWPGLAILASLGLAAYGLAQGAHLRHVPMIAALLAWFPAWLPVLLPAIVPGLTIASVAFIRWGMRRGIGAATFMTTSVGLLALVALLLVVGQDWRPALAGPLIAAVALLIGVIDVREALEKTPAPLPPRQDEGGVTDENIVGLVLNRQGQSKRTRTSGANAPTAIEFSGVFQRALRKAFATHPRVVVVIDNLDRLPPAEAKEAWAMLRTFFSASGEPGPAPAPQPLVIVPVADETVQAMFPQAGQSFMDKTFDAVFHVPGPVFTTWQAYLGECLERVFGKTVRWQSRSTVIHLADARFHDGADVTPRDIHTLVNLIATFWVQRRSQKVSFASVAFYCLHKREIEADLAAFLARPRVSLDAFHGHWQQEIAAVHFGVRPIDAAPLFLPGQFDRAISARLPESFLRAMGQPGASSVLTRHLSGYPTRGVTQAFLSNTVYCLVEAVDSGAVVQRHLWRLLIDGFSSGVWDTLSFADADAIARMLPHLEVADASTLARLVATCINNIDVDNDTPEDAQIHLWSAFVRRNMQTLKGIEHIPIKGSAETFIRVAEAFPDHPSLQRRLTTHKPAEVVLALGADIERETTTTPERFSRRLVAVRRTRLSGDWDRVATFAVNRLRGRVSGLHRLGREDLTRLHPALLLVAIHAADMPSDVIEELLASSLVGQIAVRAAQLNEWAFSGMALGLLVAHSKPIPDLGTHWPKDEHGHQLLAKAIGQTARYAMAPDFLAMPAFLRAAGPRQDDQLDWMRLHSAAEDVFDTTSSLPTPRPRDGEPGA